MRFNKKRFDYQFLIILLSICSIILCTHQNLHSIEPLDYETFVFLLDKARFILTDSGGVQEEARSMEKSLIATREKTKRAEVVEAGPSDWSAPTRKELLRILSF